VSVLNAVPEETCKMWLRLSVSSDSNALLPSSGY